MSAEPPTTSVPCTRCRPGRVWPAATYGWLLLALGGLMLVGLAGLDRQVLEWLAATWPRHEWIRDFALGAGRLGRGGWIAGGALLLLVYWRWWQVRPRLAAFCAWMLVSQASVGLATRVLKVAAGRCRPWGSEAGEFAFLRFDSVHHSFPSGHVGDAAVLATVLWCAWPRWRWAWATWVALIAAARVFSGAHFPSDVACAALLAVVGTRMIRRRWWPELAPAPDNWNRA